jgi:nicotinamidase/pyrazinamidase
MADAVIIVDMQRGFLEEGNPLYCGDGARSIIPHVVELLREEAARDSALFFTADTHDSDDKEFEMFPAHCVRGTAEAEIIPELAEFAAQGTVIHKRRYSAFFGTDLAQRLAELKSDRLIVAGVCTDICVMHTVADARNRDYAVEVVQSAVASFDPEAHRFALRHMDNILGAKLV